MSEQKKDPEFLKYVYKLTEGIELLQGLRQGLIDIEQLDMEQLNRIGLKTYAPNKWTVHKILQHLIDWERIWCFRAILFARKEGTIPVAHEQEVMAENSNADDRKIEDLVRELVLVRRSTLAMFESFNSQTLRTNCDFFEYEMPLSAIGFTITAHQIHHFNIIAERYLPLDSK